MTHATTGLIALRPPIQAPKERPQPTIAESYRRAVAMGRPAQSSHAQP